MEKIVLPIETPKWFQNRIAKVMEHNEYAPDMVTAKVCAERERWSPVDLIIREHYNNGDGSAKGFLNLTPAQNRQAFEYVRDHQEEFEKADLYSKDGVNNFGFPLWNDYKLD